MRNKSSNHLQICESAYDFFSKLIDDTIEHQKIAISNLAKTYLRNLLTDNINPENLLKKNDNNPYAETPLAILYQESLLEDLQQRKEKLKFIGDYSLYVSGFFSESLNKKLIDVDYYIGMGAVAYDSLSNISNSIDNRVLFAELYSKFSLLVEVLTEISFATNSSTSKDLIRIYDRWVKTGNTVLEKILIEKGISTSNKKLKAA